MSEYIYKNIRPEVWKRITSVIKDYKILEKDYNDTDDLYHAEVRRKVEAYRDVWNSTDDDTKQIIVYRYVCKKTYLQMEDLVYMSQITIKRKTRKFIFLLGERLGEINGNYQ